MSFRSVAIGFFSVVFFLLVALSFLSSPVQAQETQNPWQINYTVEEFAAYNDAITETGCATPSLECLVRNTTRFVAIEWVQEIMGPNFLIKCGDELCPTASLTPEERLARAPGGIIHSSLSLMGKMYTYRPASSGRYVAYVIDNADLAPPAYAQGIGFAALDPVLDLWRMFRNVAYFFFIGIFIVIGFLIMFRQSFSGKSAITAQQAIPSIIISLILVTFSYAIAGFMIDLMYLAMFGMLRIFNMALGREGIATDAVTWNIAELAANLLKGAVFSGEGWNNNVDFIGTMIDGIFNTPGGSGIGGAFAWLGGLAMSAVLAIAILIGMVKLFFELLKSYASILMNVIFAPIYLMMGAIPGTNPFGSWAKNMIGNLAAFPTVLLFVMIYEVFTSDLFELEGAAGFMPPYLVGSGQGGVAAHLLGLAVILALPEIVKEVKKKMGATEGGFGWMVASAAGARAKQSELAVPGMMGTAGGVAGGVGGYIAARRAGVSPGMDRLRAAWGGYTDAHGRTFGGATNWGGVGYRWGNKGRVFVDRLTEGRLGQAEDMEKTLSNIFEQREKSAKGAKGGGHGSGSSTTPSSSASSGGGTSPTGI